MKKVFKKKSDCDCGSCGDDRCGRISELFRKNFWLEKQNSRDGKRDGK